MREQLKGRLLSLSACVFTEKQQTKVPKFIDTRFPLLFLFLAEFFRNYFESDDSNVMEAYRELACHRVEAHVHRVLEVRRVRDVGLGVIV